MIASVWVGDFEGDASAANADVLVTLDDGRAYAFTAFTPKSAARFMEEDGSGYFWVEDMLLLRAINEDNVRAAVTDLLERDVLDRVGIRQTA